MKETDFKSFLNKEQSKEESKGLDLSIKNADKYLTTIKKITAFFNNKISIEQKTDGVKLTIVKVSNNGNLNDYIISYKSDVMYQDEFSYQTYVKASNVSIANSQFKLVQKHLSNLPKNNIPINTELFIEFLMNKPTLSSNYTKQHKMVLIGYAENITYEISYGKLSVSNNYFESVKRNEYAKELKIDTPNLLFSGYLTNEKTIQNGIVNDNLLQLFNESKKTFVWRDQKVLLGQIKDLFLNVPSYYGGVEEGVVIESEDAEVPLLKWVQDYQTDQSARFMIKQRYREDTVEDENYYWSQANNEAMKIVNMMVIKSRKLKELMPELSLIIKRLNVDIVHSKKLIFNIKDDIQQTAKTQLIKKMRGNNNALVVGKFRILTKDGHYRMIKQAKTLFDKPIICIVRNKNDRHTIGLRIKMMRLCFPDISIMFAPSANLKQITYKSKYNINVIYAGSDRVSAYQEQMKNTLGVDIREMKRTANDISASKIIENIDDIEYFKANTPEAIHSMYEEIKEVYGTV